MSFRAARKIAQGLLLTMLTVGTAAVGGADTGGLQQVTVGGEVRIRGHAWQNVFNESAPSGPVPPVLRWPGSLLSGRAIGDAIGGPCAYSYRDWDDAGANSNSVEQRTAVHIRADFQQDVTTFVELDTYGVMGDSFRSDYITGADRSAADNADLSVYQAYIEARNIWNTPLQLRIGRQELNFGGSWLVGNGDSLPEFTMLSFDAIRLSYARDNLTVDAFWSKVQENRGLEQDGDIDFSGVYATYAFTPDLTLDAYWFLLRDARSAEDSDCGCSDDIRAADVVLLLAADVDYDVTYLNTIGLRGSGQHRAWDYELEVAYQFGPADQLGSKFRRRLVGDDDARFDALAAHAELGYTFEARWNPRVYLQGAYFNGEDNREVSFWDWENPFSKPNASISFNRLFSNTPYSEILDNMGQLSNFWMAKLGAEIDMTDKISARASVAHFETVDTFESPLNVRLGGVPYVPFPTLPFLTQGSSSDMGWEVSIEATYRYSDDLVFSSGWSHLFTGDGLYDGNYSDLNGLLFNGGTDSDDADYFYAEASIRF